MKTPEHVLHDLLRAHQWRAAALFDFGELKAFGTHRAVSALERAVSHGDESPAWFAVLDALIRHLGVPKESHQGWPILAWIGCRSTGALEFLLVQRPDLLEGSAGVEAMLMLAWQRSEMAGRSALVLHRAGVEFTDSNEQTDNALSTAAAANNAEWYRVVLAEVDLDVDTLDGCGLTPLYFAVLESHYEVIDVLLGAGANPLAGPGATAMFEALRVGNAAVVQQLLNHVADDVALSEDDFVLHPCRKEAWMARHVDDEVHAGLDSRGQFRYAAVLRREPFSSYGTRTSPVQRGPNGDCLYLDDTDWLYMGHSASAELVHAFLSGRPIE